MYWEENKKVEEDIASGDVVDVAFGISCRCLPVDHAYVLSQALFEALPWLAGEEKTGIHVIHVAASGNGWFRPQAPGELLCLSRRTKLVLRMPKYKINDARQLIGKTLDVAGNEMRINKATIRPLHPITTIFSRYMVSDNSADEEAFLNDVAGQLRKLGIKPKKLLCGIERVIAIPAGPILTRSLMLADLSAEESIMLQQAGLGPHRQLGCGLFIPHKDIN